MKTEPRRRDTMKPKSRPKIEILTGPSGSGKTHLLNALEERHAREHPAEPRLRLTGADLVSIMVRAARDQTHASLSWAAGSGLGLLLIDDLDPLRLGDRTRLEAARILAEALEAGARVVAALVPAGMPSGTAVALQREPSEDPLAELLLEGKVVRLHGPGRWARMLAVRNQAKDLGAHLGRVASLRLALRTASNWGLLRGAVIQAVMTRRGACHPSLTG